MLKKKYRRESSPLETVALVHVAVLLALATWGFGGGTAWVRTALTAWGGLSLLLLFAYIVAPGHRAADRLRPLHWLWPFAGFNALILIAAFTPSFHELSYESIPLLVQDLVPAWRPSSARPLLALHELALFDALFLPCFNLALIVGSRRLLRRLLLFVVANAFALSVFGTVQKLTQAPGIFFGHVNTPQSYFFASFIYHNHWGAFAVLVTATCLGLIWHHARHHAGRDFLHTPAFGGLLIVLVIAATVPLSGSRSCTLLLAILLGGASFHTVIRLLRQRRRYRESVAGLAIGACVAAVVCVAGVWFLARDTISLRVEKTREQVAAMRANGDIGARSALYRDTWRMAAAKPWFGWGMASYPHVFFLYNTQQPTADRLPVFYADAHSDWLQSFAEHGVVGSVLLGLCALVPLAGLRARPFTRPLPAYLLAGCALVLLYAWVEFPFGNAAVVLTWWLSFFCAVRYARLNSADNAPLAAPCSLSSS